jgi:Sulfotransferase family
MDDSKRYRLVWFQHFHKAGGTSVVQLAKINGEHLYPRHKNGNPHASNGRLIELWNLDERDLTRFVDSCEQQNVTFVSTEWGLPLTEVLRNDPRVTTVTCLRDPLHRFTSNYYFCLYHGHTAARRVEDYVNSCAGPRGAYTMFNYYCRVLARHDNRPEVVDEALYRKARTVLAGFEYCTRLEAGLATLSDALGWRHREVHERKTEYGFGKALKFLARGRFDLVLRRFTHPKAALPADFVERFVRENQWDIRLYDELAVGPTSSATAGPR